MPFFPLNSFKALLKIALKVFFSDLPQHLNISSILLCGHT